MDEVEDRKVYIADDKYQCIIAALNNRGWTRSYEYECIPSTCKLMFRNLSNIKFPAVFGRYVNHFRNSQHLSNKALLAYHLRGAGCEGLQTTTWSAAFEGLPTLIGKVLLNGLKCYIVGLITSKSSSISSSISSSSWSSSWSRMVPPTGLSCPLISFKAFNTSSFDIESIVPWRISDLLM